VLLGDKPQLGLSPLLKTLAKQSAGTDGDLGLDHMVTGSQGVPARAQKIQYPFALIILEGKKQGRRSGGSTHKKHKEGGPSHTYKEKHNSGQEDNKHCGTKIRLNGYRNGETRHQKERHHDLLQTVRRRRFTTTEIPGKSQNKGKLGQFRRLEGQTSGIDPPLDTPDPLTCHCQPHQDCKYHPVKAVSAPLKVSPVRKIPDKVGHKGYSQPVSLTSGIPGKTASHGSGPDDEDPHAGKGQSGTQQNKIDPLKVEKPSQNSSPSTAGTGSSKG